VIVKNLPFVVLRNPANLDNASTLILQHQIPSHSWISNS